MLTPKDAIADYEFLKATGYWEEFSFLHFTRRYWQPMYEQAFYDQMRTRMKFTKAGGKPHQLAAGLRDAARGWERYLDENATGA